MQVSSISLKYTGKITLLALVYFLTARLGFLFPFQGEIASILWPASGLAMVGLLLFGLDLWPAIVLGSLLAAVSNNHSWQLTIGVVIAHTLEAYSGSYILRKYTSFDTKLENFSDVYYLLAFSIVIAPAIGATLGVTSFALSPEASNVGNFTFMWWHWWIAHAINLSAIVPLILTWYSPRPGNMTGKRILEFLLALGLLTTVSMLVFIRIDFFPIGNFPLGHVVFPFLLWIALRFSPREVATAGFITVFLAVMGTIEQTGPFSRPDLNFNLFLLGTFVFSVIMIMLMLSSIMAQRKRTQIELQLSHNDLEKRVAQRTSELNEANDKLLDEILERTKITEEVQKARDEAIYALDYKNQILANVSHDARTPLNIIMLNSELMQMRKDNLTDKQLQRLQTIDMSCKDMLIFINNLLDAANTKANTLEATLSPIIIRHFFDASVLKFTELAANKNITIEVNLDENMPAVITSDEDWLNKIMANLLTNAIKFTSGGKITIAVIKDSDATWQLRVRDTGIGIPENAIELIFQPFWQLDGSSTRQANRGVGLGLSIVNRFAMSLGGTIKVESKLDEGTIFIISFPLHIAETANA